MIASPSIIRRIRQWRPDVLIIKEILVFAVYVALFRRWLGTTKVLALVEGDPYQGTTRKPNWLIRAVRRFACRSIDYFLTNNDGGRIYLNEQLLVPEAKILVHPYLVSTIQPPRDLVGDNLPEVISQDNDQLKFLYVGQLVERKGIRQLIRSFELLPNATRGRVRLWLVGDGEQRTEIERQIHAARLTNVVRLLGRQPYEALPAFYQRADVFVMPTLDDYRALVGFEAIAQGLPLLHSVHDGACQEVVRPSENGFQFDPLQPQQAADRIQWFLANADRLEAMAEKSLELSRRYTVENAVAGITTAINNCLATGQSPPEKSPESIRV